MIGAPGKSDPTGYPLEFPDKVGLRSALLAGRYDDLTRWMESFQAEFEADPRKEYWPYRAFQAFDVDDPAVTKKLDAWVQASGARSFAPWAARGVHELSVGYDRRGTDVASKTSAAQFEAMRVLHVKARKDLERALKLRPKLLAATEGLLRIATSSVEKKRLSDGALKSCPLCFRPRVAFLDKMAPRWGGSYEAMEAYAAEAVAAVGDKNPRMHLLAAFPDHDRCTWLQSRGKPDEAVAFCEKAIAVGEYAGFLKTKGELLAGRESWAEADAVFSRAVVLEPQNVELLAWHARVAAERGDWTGAVASIGRARLLAPADAHVRWGTQHVASIATARGIRYVQAGEFDASKAWYEYALMIDPSHSRALYGVGYLANKNGDPRKAESAYRASIASEPSLEDAYQSIDNILGREKRFDEIETLWNSYLEKNPTEVGRGRFWRSRGRFFSGRTTEALEDVDAACKANFPGACAQALDFRARLAASPTPSPAAGPP